MKQRKKLCRLAKGIARTMTTEQCAEVLGIGRRRLLVLGQRGVPHTPARGPIPSKWCAEEVVAGCRRLGIDLDAGPGRPSEASPELLAARLRKERALAERYELAVAVMRGEMIPLAAVEQWMARSVTTARNRLLGLPAVVAPALEGRDAAERAAIIDERVREVLDELERSGEAFFSEMGVEQRAR